VASFGVSVAVSADGGTLLGGQLNSFRPGGAFVFTRSGATWSQQAKLAGGDTVTADDFGDGVSLSGDGSTAVVAAPGKNASTGAVYVFTGGGATWVQQQELAESNPNRNDQLGVPLAVDRDGGTVVAGAEGRNNGMGAAFVFGLPAPSVATVTPTSGLTVGGVVVTIAGTGFRSGASVAFGGLPATNVAVVNDTTLTATVPQHAAGGVDVTVTNPDTQFGTLPGGFVYQPIPPPAPRPSGQPPSDPPPPPMPAARPGSSTGETPAPMPSGR
jgi:hypothetical protein